MHIIQARSDTEERPKSIAVVFDFCEYDIFRRGLYELLEKNYELLKDFFKNSTEQLSDDSLSVDKLKYLVALKMFQEANVPEKDDIQVENELVAETRKKVLDQRDELAEYFQKVRGAFCMINRVLSSTETLKRRALKTTLCWLKETGKDVDAHFADASEETKRLIEELKREI